MRSRAVHPPVKELWYQSVRRLTGFTLLFYSLFTSERFSP